MISIIIEGGIVQGCVTNDPTELGKVIRVIDYDTDGLEENKTTVVRDTDGVAYEAYVIEHTVEESILLD